MTTPAETTAWLVDIPSPTGSEGPICSAIAERLDHRPLRRHGETLVVGERTGRPLVLVVGHLDTVPSQGQPPARLDGGTLHGLGAADMKGGLAVMIHLLEERPRPGEPYDLVGVFYDAEEGPMDGNGLGPLLEREPWLVEAAFAVVAEPSDGEIQVGCNGSINASVVFTGRSAHSARPWWGENAITKAGGWLAELHRAERDTRRVGGLEYHEVMSATLASGGLARNVIPDRFTINLNYRFSPDRSVDEALDVLRDRCSVADELEVVDVAPAGPVDTDHPLLRRLAAVSGAGLAAKQGWTDVARLGAHGVPAVNFGPGRASEAHQRDEFVDVSEIDATLAAMREFLGTVD